MPFIAHFTLGHAMGLDISAYQGLCFASPKHGDDEDEDLRRIYINPDFASRCSDLPDPCYFSGCAASHGFRAGSYSGYGMWREELARFAGYPMTRDQDPDSSRSSYAGGAWALDGGPFWELINFSDCEGAIGPGVSAKLFEDFQSRLEDAKAFAADPKNRMGSHFLEVYEDFLRAFELASVGGAVSFH